MFDGCKNEISKCVINKTAFNERSSVIRDKKKVGARIEKIFSEELYHNVLRDRPLFLHHHPDHNYFVKKHFFIYFSLFLRLAKVSGRLARVVLGSGEKFSFVTL